MIQDVLQSFFGMSPKADSKGYRYIAIEQEEGYVVCTSVCDMEDVGKGSISISYNDEQEVWVVWHQNHHPIVTIQRFAVRQVIASKEDGEELLQFVFERWPSRMLQVQLKPYFAVEMGMYWETCEECD